MARRHLPVSRRARRVLGSRVRSSLQASRCCKRLLRIKPPLLEAPRRRRNRHGFCHIKFHAKPSLRPFAPQLVHKLFGRDLHSPHVGARRWDERNGGAVGHKRRCFRRAACACVAAILRHSVFAAVFMPMMVLEPQQILRGEPLHSRAPSLRRPSPVQAVSSSWPTPFL